MAQSLSKTMIIGNLGANPDVRYLPNGNPVANISVATTDSWKDKSTGKPMERTEWHRVVVFGPLAELVGKFCSSGSKVYVEGRNQTRGWEKDGVKRYTTEIIVDMAGMIQFLDPRPASAAPNGATPAPNVPEPSTPSSGAMSDYPHDDDIPFRELHYLTGV